MRKRHLLFASIFLVSSGVVQAQERTPYLQRLTPNEVTIVWRTSSSGQGRVCYGTSPSDLSSTQMDTRNVQQHEVRITGLRPDTRYYYSATTGSCSSTADERDTFRTAPTPGTRRPFRVWVLGDSGNGSERQTAVYEAMRRFVGTNRPDLFLHVGDMAYDDGTDQEFTDNFFGVYADTLRNAVCWPAFGNHEGISSSSDSQSGPYYEGYVLPTDGVAGGLSSSTEAYYSFDYANVHFVVLDSHDSPLESTGPMLRWLDDDLAATDQQWVVAYWHHPPYTRGTYDSDRADSTFADMRENAGPIIEAHGVDLVFGGHSHVYERSYLVNGAFDTPTVAAGHIVDNGDGRPDGDGAYNMDGLGTVYIVAGHGGRGVRMDGTHPLMYFSEAEHGSVIVDVDGPRMTLYNISS